jgi:hypothetical protein
VAKELDILVDRAVVDTFVQAGMRDIVYRDVGHAIDHLGQLIGRLQAVGTVTAYGPQDDPRPFGPADATVEYRGRGLHKAAYRFSVPGARDLTEVVVFRTAVLPDLPQ